MAQDALRRETELVAQLQQTSKKTESTTVPVTIGALKKATSTQNTSSATFSNDWSKADPLDLSWINHDWPHALLDDQHCIIWKRVGLQPMSELRKNFHGFSAERPQHQTSDVKPDTANRRVHASQSIMALGDHYPWANLQQQTFFGALDCPYDIGIPTKPHGPSNWLLSPLGALKENYWVFPFALAAIAPVSALRMRGDQVLISQEEQSVLPVAVWGLSWFINTVTTLVGMEEASKDVDGNQDLSPFAALGFQLQDERGLISDQSFKSTVLIHLLAKRWLSQPNAHAAKIDAIEVYMHQRVCARLNEDWNERLQGIVLPTKHCRLAH